MSLKNQIRLKLELRRGEKRRVVLQTEVEREVSCFVVSGYIHVECRSQRFWPRVLIELRERFASSEIAGQ